MKKKIIIIALAVVSVAASVAAGFATHSFALSREAAAQFKSTLGSLVSDNETLTKTKDELKTEVSNTEQEIENKNEISAEAQEYADRLDELKMQVDEANRTLTGLDESIQKKEEYIEQADSIKKQSRGRSVSLTDKTVKCPDDIAAGRYIAEGKGNLLIYNSSNKLRISENLTDIDTNSFTFDLDEGEAVKATETLTLTALK